MNPSPAFRSHYDRHALSALDQQLHVIDVVGEGSWQFDMGAGAVTFQAGTAARTVPVQILGTESHGDHTWLWGWANAASGIPGRRTR